MVRLVETGDAVEGGGLARPVGADERRDAPSGDLERAAIERPHTSEGLADLTYRQGPLGGRGQALNGAAHRGLPLALGAGATRSGCSRRGRRLEYQLPIVTISPSGMKRATRSRTIPSSARCTWP